jgi:hypothetical protein
MKISKTVGLVAALVVLLVAGTAVAAWAALRDDETEKTGACGVATYQLTVERDDTGPEVSLELTSAAPGEVWDVTVSQDDETLFEGQRTTDEDGEVDLDVPATGDGEGLFTATATPQAGGDTCEVEVRRG